MKYDKVLDNGKNKKKFQTGGIREVASGKGRYDLLPTRAMRRLAEHYENGVHKYDDRNWEKGLPIGHYTDSALRHTFKFLEGQTDEDHLAAAVWNLMCIMETMERIEIGMLPKELMDLPAWQEYVKKKKI